MSAIIDHAVFGTEARTRHPGTGPGKCSREAEFRAALDSYMEDYRKHGGIKADKESCGPRVAGSAMIRKLASRAWRQILGFHAICWPTHIAAFRKTPFW